MNKPRIFTRFIRKISLPSLCKGKNRSQLQCLDQNHSISIAKPSPTPTYLYDFKAQVCLDSTSHLLPGERRSQETSITYREFVTLEFENSESPAYNQLELEIPLNCWMCPSLCSPYQSEKVQFELCCLERIIASNSTWLCLINLYATVRKPLYIFISVNHFLLQTFIYLGTYSFPL